MTTRTDESGTSTADRILEAARRRFNEQGYDATTLTEIADDVGIRQGNLTYHFPTKHDLVLALRERLMNEIRARNERPRPDDVTDAYVERLVFMLDVNSRYRTLIRDRPRFDDAPPTPGPTPEMVAGFAELRELVGRVHDAGLMRRDLEVDLDTLTRTAYIVGRHWPDHLREMEGRVEMNADDVVRGVENHLTVLTPHLNAAGRRSFEAALRRACDQLGDLLPLR